MKEGGLSAAKRKPLNWENNPDFFDEEKLNKELERVFDICHGCRRCVSLCQSFPRLFELVDKSTTMEVDGVDQEDYQSVVDECFLCDLCFEVKCPYVPPHEWDVDFPHLMLRAKMIKHKKHGITNRERLLSSPDKVGSIASIPVVSSVINTVNNIKPFRVVLEKTHGIHRDAPVPKYNRWKKHSGTGEQSVVLFSGCYANYNSPSLAEDLISVYEKNGIGLQLIDQERCCGMPKLELGDIESVKKTKDFLVEQFMPHIDKGRKIISPVPSCVLMFRKEWVLLFPDDLRLKKIAEAVHDPCEHLLLMHKKNILNVDFTKQLGKVSYHSACHQRVQNIGSTTRKLLEIVPGTTVQMIERCAGHDGTYAVKLENYEKSKQMVIPLVSEVKKFSPDYFCSDCTLAGGHIINNLPQTIINHHPLSLLRIAYGN